MSEMVERVARAIFEWEYRDIRLPRPEVHPQWAIYEGAARAAIEAMREYTANQMLIRPNPKRHIDPTDPNLEGRN